MYSWLTYFSVFILLLLRILYPKQEKADPRLLKAEHFYFSLDIRPNENPALKISFTPTTRPNGLITPLELNHIEFSALAYYCKGYSNERGSFVVASGLKETRFFNIKPGNNGFRINTARVVPTNDTYIISRRSIVFRNIDLRTIKAFEDVYDSYFRKTTYEGNTVVDI